MFLVVHKSRRIGEATSVVLSRVRLKLTQCCAFTSILVTKAKVEGVVS